MKEIAEEAGVAQGLLHYYFDTKDRLLEQLVARLLDEHLEHFRADLARVGPARRRELGLAVLRKKALGDRKAWRLLFEVLSGSARDGNTRALGGRFAERRALVARQIGGKHAEAKALLLDAVMLGLAAERLAGASDRDAEAAFDAFVALLA